MGVIKWLRAKSLEEFQITTKVMMRIEGKT